MKKLCFFICIIFLISCERNIKNDTKKQVDTIAVKKQENIVENSIENIDEYDTYDSIYSHISDSLRKVVSYINKNQNINIEQRIKRIKQLYSSIATPGSIWANSNLNIDEFEFVADEIGILLTDTNIVNYNIDSIFFKISKNDITVATSEDSRLCVISYCYSDGGNSNSPLNIFVWRDSNNKPQNYIIISPMYENKYGLWDLAYFEKNYKLKNTLDKSLYLIMGGSKGRGNNALIVEIRNNQLNFDYKGFIENYKRKNNYNIGIDTRNEPNWENYNFDKSQQIIKYTKTSSDYYNKRFDTLTIGTLKFNGKYFDEKLIKRKIN